MKLAHSILVAVAVTAAAACAAWGAVDLFAQDRSGQVKVASATSLIAEAALPGFDGAVEWLNSPPLSAAQLRGKVVLVDFWTFTCINWQRTLPHVRAWADKYKDQGLVVIGVHTPEFSFERDLDKVRGEVARLDVGFPVAVDSNRAIWNAFGNSYWPALYFIDGRGRIRHRQFGEGEYEKSERMIQRLLAEAGAHDVPADLVQVTGSGSLAAADWPNLRSPETYVGRDRADGFASPGGTHLGQARDYRAPERLRLNTWAFSGTWNMGHEGSTAVQAGSRIVYSFHARDLHLVMGSAEAGRAVPFRVRIDGLPPGDAHGADVDAEGRGMLREHRLYQLVRQRGAIEDRQFEIEFLAPGAEAYSFTFG